MAEAFLRKRALDPRSGTGARVDLAPRTAITPWYESSDRRSSSAEGLGPRISRHTFAADKMPSDVLAGFKGKKKDKEGNSSSDSDKSDDDDDMKSRKKKKRMSKSTHSEKSGDGKKKGRCWEGYEPVEGPFPPTALACCVSQKTTRAFAHSPLASFCAQARSPTQTARAARRSEVRV